MPKLAPAVRLFNPEMWGEVDRFQTFCSTTYLFGKYHQRVLSGVSNHLHKSQRFLRLAETLLPKLEIDDAELEEHGFTNSKNAANLASILEAAITEIYSAVDCTAIILHHVYGKSSRGYKKSTSRLFSHADKITGSFPDRLKETIIVATWFKDLHHIRDELTHSDVGSCSKDKDTGTIRYFHSSLREGDRSKHIEDIFGWIWKHFADANAFIGLVFNELNTTIIPGTVVQHCGMVEGLMLSRFLDTKQPIDFNNGSCMSSSWFDKPDNPSCPFQKNCGAYQRPASPDRIQNHFEKA